MNLIKQLGGYSVAKAEANAPVKLMNSFSYEQLDKELLEYRRENSIFQAGDIITYNESDFLYKINTANSSGFHATTVHEVNRQIIAILGHDNVKHATTQEIKAGCRL